MNKMLVAVFDAETAAFEGLSALKDLHKDGDITLYATTVLIKDNAGKITVKQTDAQGPAGTAVGFLTGRPGSCIVVTGPGGLACAVGLIRFCRRLRLGLIGGVSGFLALGVVHLFIFADGWSAHVSSFFSFIAVARVAGAIRGR